MIEFSNSVRIVKLLQAVIYELQAGGWVMILGDWSGHTPEPARLNVIDSRRKRH
jgi:hypothetical protein